MPSSPRSCPCKQLRWSLSSFTAAEFGDVSALTRARNKSTTPPATRYPDTTGGITPLHLAAQHGHVAATWWLLEQGHPVDGVVAPTVVNDHSSSWGTTTTTTTSNSTNTPIPTCTPLHRAAFAGALATMKLLLERQANLLARDKSFGDERTPLHKAAAGGRYLAVALLLDALREPAAASSSSGGPSPESSRDPSASLLFQQALTARDRNQQTPLQVALDYQRIQETERQSVARWDVVAGGMADWDQCVSLLEDAAREVGIDPQGGGMTVTTKSESRLFTKLPQHRFTELDCLGCAQNGECVTAQWSAAFQNALQQCVAIPPSSASETDPKMEPSRSIAHEDKIGMDIVTAGEKSSGVTESIDVIPALLDDIVHPSSLSTSSMGRVCGACGRTTIVLFPSGPDRGLVCKKCKPKRRARPPTC